MSPDLFDETYVPTYPKKGLGFPPKTSTQYPVRGIQPNPYMYGNFNEVVPKNEFEDMRKSRDIFQQQVETLRCQIFALNSKFFFFIFSILVLNDLLT